MDQRWFRLKYEIDIDAVSVEDAVRKVMKYVRDRKITASWDYVSSEDDCGLPLPKISGLAHYNPDGSIEVIGSKS